MLAIDFDELNTDFNLDIEIKSYKDGSIEVTQHSDTNEVSAMVTSNYIDHSLFEEGDSPRVILIAVRGGLGSKDLS
jgi:hypothetical protein